MLWLNFTFIVFWFNCGLLLATDVFESDHIPLSYMLHFLHSISLTSTFPGSLYRTIVTQALRVLTSDFWILIFGPLRNKSFVFWLVNGPNLDRRLWWSGGSGLRVLHRIKTIISSLPNPSLGVRGWKRVSCCVSLSCRSKPLPEPWISALRLSMPCYAPSRSLEQARLITVVRQPGLPITQLKYYYRNNFFIHSCLWNCLHLSKHRQIRYDWADDWENAISQERV